MSRRAAMLPLITVTITVRVVMAMVTLRSQGLGLHAVHRTHPPPRA